MRIRWADLASCAGTVLVYIALLVWMWWLV